MGALLGALLLLSFASCQYFYEEVIHKEAGQAGDWSWRW
jgi:hypothetical protein